MNEYDVVLVLGAQIGVDEKGKMSLALHTKMRAAAAGIAYQREKTKNFLISGGYNFGVRYPLDVSSPVFGTANSYQKPNFSDEAKMKARHFRSEASVIAEFLRAQYNVPPESLILEEDSATTKDNAALCRTIVKRQSWKRVGLLTQLFHMTRALPLFQSVGLKVEPIFAEDYLMFEDKWLSQICEYYGSPKGGKQWDVSRIHNLLASGKTVGELITS